MEGQVRIEALIYLGTAILVLIGVLFILAFLYFRRKSLVRSTLKNSSSDEIKNIKDKMKALERRVSELEVKGKK